MIEKRLIPTLLIENGGCYKSIKFKKYRYVGDPLNISKIFNSKLVDELIVLDINASKLNKPPDFELLRDIASECFMPLAYGGGISTLEIADKIFSLGFEKIILNNSILKNPEFLKNLSLKYGSQSLVASIDVYKHKFGGYSVYNHVKRKTKKIDCIQLAKIYQSNGAGEIFLNHVKRDGTFLGLDLELYKRMISELSIPIIICGGLKNKDDYKKAFSSGIDAVAGGSFFVYQGVQKAVLISYPSKKIEFAKEFFHVE